MSSNKNAHNDDFEFVAVALGVRKESSFKITVYPTTFWTPMELRAGGGSKRARSLFTFCLFCEQSTFVFFISFFFSFVFLDRFSPIKRQRRQCISRVSMSILAKYVNVHSNLGNQTLFLDVGSTVTVSRTYLNVIHETLEPEEILFTVMRKPHLGKLQLDGKVTSSFSQADVNKGEFDSLVASAYPRPDTC